MKPTNIDDARNKKRLVNTNGVTLEVVENADYEEPITPRIVGFYDWLAKHPITPTLADLWTYKQGEILAITEDWEASVLFGKEALKETIDNVKLLNSKLQGENAQLLKEIESLR